MKRIVIGVIIACIICLCGYIFYYNMNGFNREFYSDREIEKIVKTRYGNDCKLISKENDYFEVSYEWTNTKDRFNTIIYTYVDDGMTFNVTSYYARPGFEGNIDYGKTIETNYYEKYVLKLKKDNFVSDLDYGIDNESHVYIRVNNVEDIEKAYDLIEEIRTKIGKEDDTYFRFYIRNEIVFNSSMTKYEPDDKYYVSREYLEREYTEEIRKAMKYSWNKLHNDLPDIDETWFEKYKPDNAIIDGKIYGELDLKFDDYFIEWNRRYYDSSSPKKDIIGSNIINFAGGEVTYLDENTMNWTINGDQFEMNMIVLEIDEPDEKTTEYYEYRKVAKNKFEYANKTYEYIFKKNNEIMDIEIFNAFTYQGTFYGNIELLMKDVEKLINSEINMNYITGEISFSNAK